MLVKSFSHYLRINAGRFNRYRVGFRWGRVLNVIGSLKRRCFNFLNSGCNIVRFFLLMGKQSIGGISGKEYRINWQAVRLVRSNRVRGRLIILFWLEHGCGHLDVWIDRFWHKTLVELGCTFLPTSNIDNRLMSYTIALVQEWSGLVGSVSL